MSTPLSPEPLKGRAVDALPPYVSNGLVGMRCPGLPHLRGTTMVGGFAACALAWPERMATPAEPAPTTRAASAQ